QLRAILLGSDEYYVGSGGNTDTGFLSALYQDVLGRAIDSSALASSPRQLTTEASRGGLARQLLSSDEGSHDRVEELYQWILQRAAAPNGQSTSGETLHNGGSEQNVIPALASSDEYFSQPERQLSMDVQRTTDASQSDGSTSSGLTDALLQERAALI